MAPSRPFVLDDRLESWKEIAWYLKRDVRTVQRWEKTASLPVHRLKIEKAGSVYAYKSELNAWWNERRSVLEPQSEERKSWQLLVWRAVKRHRLASGMSLGFLCVVLGCLLVVRWWRSIRIFGVKPSHKQVTFLGTAYAPAISPDGLYVAYVSRKYGEDERLIVQATNGATLEIASGERIVTPRWAPDGSQLMYFRVDASKKLWRTFIVSALGGPARELGGASHACWLDADGSQIATAGGSEPNGTHAIKVLSTTSGESREIQLPPYSWLDDIDCSPSTGSILVVTESSKKFQILALNRDGGGQVKVAEEPERIYSARFSPEGDAVYYFHSASGTSFLSKVKVSSSRSDPVVLASGLQSGDFFSISADGTRLIYTRLIRSSNLWRVRWGAVGNVVKPEARQITSGTFSHAYPAYSPDGKWVMFCRGGDSDAMNIFRMPTDQANPIQLTFFATGSVTSPSWSPDGRRIAFVNSQGDTTKVWTMSAAGEDLKVLESTNASNTSGYVAWWPNKNIVYQQPGNRNFLQVNEETGAETEVLRTAPATGWVPLRPVFSPNGKQIAVFWNRTVPGTWIISSDPYSESLLKPGEFYPLGWSPDGKFIYGIPKAHGRQIMRVQVANPHAETLVADLPGSVVGYDNAAVSPDRSELIISIREEKSDVWSMENFDPARSRPQHRETKVTLATK